MVVVVRVVGVAIVVQMLVLSSSSSPLSSHVGVGVVSLWHWPHLRHLVIVVVLPSSPSSSC